ncbi:MAG: hypothetical protein ACM3QX_07455 [Syntrophomonadaceae bacterium]
MKKLYTLVVLLLMSFLIASCSKKDDNPNGPGTNDTAPGIPTVTFKGPNTNSTDQFALLTKSSVESMNAYPMLFYGVFASIPPSNSDGKWQWVVKPGGTATETFTASKNSDGSFTWKLILNGTIDNNSYNNWKALEGTTSADGKNGNWKIFDDNTTILVGEFNWSTNSGGILSGTMLSYNNGVASGKIEVVNNPDNSGSLKVYGETNVLEFLSTWKADGTGTWHSYDNGVEKTNGNWQ